VILAGDGVRVLLVGTGSHVAGSSLPDVSQVPGTLRALGACLTDCCGLAAEHLQVLLDPVGPADLQRKVAEVAESAGTVLLIYYLGHGVTSHQGELHLATRASADLSPDSLEDQALPFRRLAETVRYRCTAGRVFIVLDCCNSSRARLPSLGWTLLASAGRDDQAVVPAGEKYPAYTGELIRVLSHGDPQAPPDLTVHLVQAYLLRMLEQAGRPVPQAFLGGNSAGLVFAPNRAYRRPAQSSDLGGADTAGEPRYEDVCPYRGLQPYTEEDARFFYGRAGLTREVVRRMADRMWTGGLTLVTGASGAGKSSLLRAGVLPSIHRGDLGIDGSAGWPQAAFAPGDDPAGAFARALADVLPEVPVHTVRETLLGDAAGIRAMISTCLTTRPADRVTQPGGAQRLIIIVDQAEELFTLCLDRDTRTFLLAVAALTDPDLGSGPLAAVAFGLGSAFFGQCADYPELKDAAEHEPVLVGPMTSAELREAIVEPAAKIGLVLDDGLADLLIEDIADHAYSSPAGYDTGALPLVSVAMLVTWQNRRGGRLTVDGYIASGRVQGALQQQADSAYEELGGQPAAQEAMRTLLLELVSVGQNRPDTRRRVPITELLAGAAGQAGVDEAAAGQALASLITHRLVSTETDIAQIAHEALIGAWPRLRDWIDEGRDRSLVRQELDDQARKWESSGRSPSFLYRGSQLVTATTLLGGGPAARRGLRGLPGDFLAASERQERRRRTGRVLGNVAIAVIAAVATLFGLIARADSHAEIGQRDQAIVRELIAEYNALQGSQPGLARQLLAQAYRMPATGASQSTDGALLTSLATPRTVTAPGIIDRLSFSRGSPLLAVAENNTARLVDPATGSVVKTFSYPGIPLVTGAELSPGGTLLAVSVGDTVDLWDVADPSHPVHLPPIKVAGNLAAVAFSANGQLLATSDARSIFRANSQITLWNIAKPVSPVVLSVVTMRSINVNTVVFSPDGQTLVTASGGQTLLWGISDPRAPAGPGTIPSSSNYTAGAAFTPDGKVLAVGSVNKPASLWNVTDPEHPVLLTYLPGDASVNAVAFGPNGRNLITTSDNDITLWDAANPAAPTTMTTLNIASGASTAALSPDGRTLATANSKGSVLLWNVPEPSAQDTIDLTGSYTYTALTRDSKILAIGSVCGASLWSMSQPQSPRLLTAITNPEVGTCPADAVASLSATVRLTSTVAFDPSGQILALGGGTDLSLWDITNPARPVERTIIREPTNVDIAAFSSDGHLLVIASRSEISLWDVADLAHPVWQASITGSRVKLAPSMAVSPDGRTLAVGGYSSANIWRWNISNPAKPLPLSPLPSESEGLAFSPDGDLLAASGYGTSTLWSLSGASPTAVSLSQAVTTGQVGPAAFSPDSRTLAIGVGASTYIWDTTDPQHPAQLAVLPASPDSDTWAATFSANGQFLVTAYDNGTVSIWDVNAADLASRLCNGAGPAITRAEWDQLLPGLAYAPPCR